MKYYSVSEVVEMLSLHRNTVMNWIYAGKLKAVKMGRVWRIKDEDLKEFIEGGK